MEKQAYYFARIETAVEGLRAGVTHPALHELLDIIDEARYYLEGIALPQPMQWVSASCEVSGSPTAEKKPGKRCGRRCKKDSTDAAALAADLQKLIDQAGCTNIPDAVNLILHSGVKPCSILGLLNCTLAELTALFSGKADDGLADKFLAVFKLKTDEEA